MITIQEAKECQAQLQQEAREILDYYQLEPLLVPLGTLHTVGSFRYGWMVKPDIDFLIYNDKPDFEPLLTIAHKMMHLPGMGKVSIANHFAWPDIPGVPKSMYLCLKPNWQGTVWQIDIHMLKPEDHADKDNFALGWEKKLTGDQKDAILLLKYQLKEQGRYGTDFWSADIYRAVMNNHVLTLKDLELWRQTHPFY